VDITGEKSLQDNHKFNTLKKNVCKFLVKPKKRFPILSKGCYLVQRNIKMLILN